MILRSHLTNCLFSIRCNRETTLSSEMQCNCWKRKNMDAFNVICGLATIASLLLTMWMYWEGKRKEAVERERMAHIAARLRDLLSTATAIEQQATLLAGIADREETPKKELKHLAVGILMTVHGLQKSLTEELK